jgi:hypothetical protein
MTKLVPVAVRVIAARAEVLVNNWGERNPLLAILVVPVLLGARCEGPEAIREIAKVGTDSSRTNLPWRVVAWHPVAILIAIVFNEYKATWCHDVLGNTNEVASLIVNAARICDLLDVSSPAVIDKQLDIGAFNGLLHPRDGHQFLLGEIDPLILLVADCECLGRLLVGGVLGSHLVAVLGSILVGEGVGHLGELGGLERTEVSQLRGAIKIYAAYDFNFFLGIRDKQQTFMAVII